MHTYYTSGHDFRYSVQCVLMINMFNEKIYLTMWYWSMFLSVLNLINLLYCLGISMNPRERVRYIRNFIRTSPDEDETEIRIQKKFVLRFLRQDGVLLIKKISYHASPIAAVKLTRSLYDDFKMRKIRRRWKKLFVTETKASQTDIVTEKKPNCTTKGKKGLSIRGCSPIFSALAIMHTTQNLIDRVAPI